VCLAVDERAARRGLTPLDTHSAAGLAELFAAHGKSLWYYYTPFLLGQERASQRRVFTGDLEGSTVALIYRNRRRRETCDLVLPPLPVSEDALRAAVAVAEELAPSPRRRILWCDESDAQAIGALGLGQPEPVEPDLIYDPARVAELAGADFRDVRKRVKRVQRDHDIRVRTGTADDLPDCRRILQQWFDDRVGSIRPIGDMGYTRGTLTLVPELGPPLMELYVYDVDGLPAAFTMGGDIRPGLLCFFALKALPQFRGLATYIRWDSLRRWGDRGLVNDGSDLGRPGLRQQKRKFRPVDELPVWQVALGDAGVGARA